jgi:hypothetical protein
MNPRRPLPSLDALRYLFNLDAERGVLVRAVSRAPNAQKGDIVGTIDGKGYLHVNISGAFFRVHRIVFFMHHGYEPEFGIDHIDCNRSNNRPSNLRPATNQQNAGNVKAPRHNTSGYKGVYRHSRGGKWCAQIKRNRQTVYLGWFDTAELAAAAYNAAALDHFGEYARGSHG